MKHVVPSLLLLAASLSASLNAFAQEAPSTQPTEMTARVFQPAVTEPLSTQTIGAETPEAPVQVELTGYVLNERKQPLRGATVMLKGTTSVVSTDADGHYALQVPAGINTLLYDYVGCEGRELSASNFLPVTVILNPAGGRGKSRSQK